MGLSGRLRKAVWTWLFGQLVLDDFELTDTTKTMSTVDTGLGRTLGSSRVVLRLGHLLLKVDHSSHKKIFSANCP